MTRLKLREELRKIQSSSAAGKKRIDAGVEAGDGVEEEEIGTSLEVEESLNLNIKKVVESDEE